MWSYLNRKPNKELPILWNFSLWDEKNFTVVDHISNQFKDFTPTRAQIERFEKIMTDMIGLTQAFKHG